MLLLRYKSRVFSHLPQVPPLGEEHGGIFSIIISLIPQGRGIWKSKFFDKFLNIYTPTLIMSEAVLIICPNIFKIFGYHNTCQLITFIIKFSWLMTPKRKLKQISNYVEKSKS